MTAGSAPLNLVVPGSLHQLTGGYLYDARMMEGLTALGWTVVVHELDGSFPEGDTRAKASLEETLGALPDDARVLLDGLALGGLPEPLEGVRHRLRAVALVHHALADETGLDGAERARLRDLELRALSNCRGVIVTSSFTASRLASWGVSSARVRTVRPGTDPAPPARGPDPGLPPCLLSVGSVTRRKGHDVLIRALALVRDLPWTCVIAGSLHRDASFAVTVVEEVSRMGLEDRIRFVGEQTTEALNALYDSASLFVLASHFEGFGMALAEALARGLPVVSTTGGAIPETVPRDAGVLVPPGDEVSLAEALGGLLEEHHGPTRRRQLSAGAREHATNLATWEVASRSLAVALEELFSGD